MKLSCDIDERLWKSIETSYERGLYTTAILDGLHFISDVIREKTGLDSDGHALVSGAFGGQSPRLKVNKLQTESEKNVQKGLEHLLRGIYSAIRNPRSHEKYSDQKETADAILVFLSYLLQVIDQSKSQYSVENFLKRIFDPAFVESDRYADLLLKEVPRGQRLDLLIRVYRKAPEGEVAKIGYFTRAAYTVLDENEQSEMASIISNDLDFCGDIKTISYVVLLFPGEIWELLKPTSRLRAENMLIQEVLRGKYDAEKQVCISGDAAICAHRISQHFSLSDELFEALLSKLASDDKQSQDYVFKYFFSALQEDRMSEEKKRWLHALVRKGLKNNDPRYYKRFRERKDLFGPQLRSYQGPKRKLHLLP